MVTEEVTPQPPLHECQGVLTIVEPFVFWAGRSVGEWLAPWLVPKADGTVVGTQGNGLFWIGNLPISDHYCHLSGCECGGFGSSTRA